MEIAWLEPLVPAKLVNILRRIPRSVHSETHAADGRSLVYRSIEFNEELIG
jgi:hypothetical protein